MKISEVSPVGESFAFQGFSSSGTMMCILDGDNIVQVDYLGNRKVIGKTAAMLAVWEYKHEEHIEAAEEVTVMQSMFKRA